MSGLTTSSTLPLELYSFTWRRKGGHVDALFCWEGEEGSHFAALLHAAAVHGQLAVAKEVLKRDATVDLPNSIGNTPLMRAAAGGQPAVLLLLLEHSPPGFCSEGPLTPEQRNSSAE